MRRTTRLGRTIGLLKVRVASQTPSPYPCSACRYQAAFSTSATQAADQKEPFTEKIRKRIWGTDAPPGLDDPYDGRSVFDKTKKRAQEQKVEEREELKEKRKAVTPDISTYEPAETWDGLEHVGGFEEYMKEWDAEHRFKGFLPAEVMTDSAEVTAALHRAMVEVLALQQAGKPLQDIANRFPAENLAYEVQIRSSPTGVTLHFAEGASLEDIVQSLAPAVDETAEKSNPTESEEDVAADRSSVDPLHPEAVPSTGTEETSTKEFPTESEEDVAADRSDEDPLHKSALALTYDALVASWDPSWLQISLDNPEMKFAVVKRTLQLTGVRIPDSAINSSRTVQALLTHLVTPPKPRKIVDALKQKENLLALPNVSVFERRLTPVDKEKSVGRWKLIEQELKRRDLPVTGH